MLPRALPNTANLINQPPVASCRRCVRECRDENMGIGAFLPAKPAAKGQICGVADGGLVHIDNLQAQKKTSVDVFFVCLVGRGNLKRLNMLLKYIIKIRFYFCLEYLLEYQWLDLNSGPLGSPGD